MRFSTLLLGPLLLLACAARPPAPASGGVPPDFRLQVVSTGATNPHCDYDITVDGAGRLRYAVEHRGAKVADRRGEVALAAGAVRGLWGAVASGGLLDHSPVVSPREGGQERGVVLFRVRAGGREREVLADHGGTPATDGVLQALFRVTPRRVWRVPGER